MFLNVIFLYYDPNHFHLIKILFCLLCFEFINGKESQTHGSAGVYVDFESTVAMVDDRFVSFALDSELMINHWKRLNFSSSKLRILASALSPGYLRIGGNAADFLIFERNCTFLENSKIVESLYTENFEGRVERKNLTNFCMSARDYDLINNFAFDNKFRLLFDLNVLLRDSRNQWNATNALDIIKYSIDNNYTKNLDFELGNEPNSFEYAYHRNVSASQLGNDFVNFFKLLRSFKGFSNSLIVGPDVTRVKKKMLEYLTTFLHVAHSKINAITWHHYYIDGKTADLQDFLKVRILDSFVNETEMLFNALQQSGYVDPIVWLGETSSCWGGGALDLSDRYVAGFMWLDKLGHSARRGIKVVIRQTLFGGNYALLDKHLDPNPDFWLTCIYKMFVGNKVLDVRVNGTKSVRLFAHCTPAGRYSPGAITVYGSNLNKHNVSLNFDGKLMNLVKDLYWLEPHGTEGLKSKKVSLSGKELLLKNDLTLPSVDPIHIPSHQSIVLPKWSFGFIVFPDARAAACIQ